jgi:hypothetical protein
MEVDMRSQNRLKVGSKAEFRYDINSQEGRDQAVSDVKRWLGRKGFDQLVQVIAAGHYNPRWIRNAMGLLQGIEGYPVRAMIQRYHPVSIRLYGIDCRGKNVVPLRRAT